MSRIRGRWPDTRIVLRTDSGFCREALLAWCEGRESVDYVIGVAKNARLERMIADELADARAGAAGTGAALRRVRLRHPGQLEPRAAGGGEGRGAAAVRRRRGREGQPEVHRDVARSRQASGARALRILLLRARGRGEPGEGAEGRPVLGALLDEPVRRERPAAVPEHLRDGAGQPPQGRAGGRRDTAGKGLSGHAAEPAPEDRGARAGQFAAHTRRAFQHLPGQAGVRAGLALALPPLTAESGVGPAPARQRTRRRGVSSAPQSGTGPDSLEIGRREAEPGTPHTRIRVPKHSDHRPGAQIPLVKFINKGC